VADAGETVETEDDVVALEDTPVAPEEAAMHIDETVADEAADELAADADLSAEAPEIAAEEALELEQSDEPS
jgi:hypothetical protein